MEEREAVRVIDPRPEDILTTKEAQLLQAAERGERPCLNCGKPLRGEKLIIPGVYEDVVLECPKQEGGCGFVEF